MNKQREQMLVRYKQLGSGQGTDFYFERSLDLIFSPGCFTVEIDHTDNDVGLPVEYCGCEHYIVGTLIVTDNDAPTLPQDNRMTGQVLVFTPRENKETKIFTRTLTGGKWSEWRSFAYAGMFDKISTPDELLATVAGLVNENTRAKEVEINVKRTAVDVSSLACIVGNKNVTITGKSMDGNVKHSIEIPAATPEKAGVMSAEDKLRMLKIETITLNKELSLSVHGFYSKNGLDTGAGEKAMNTGLVYFKGYTKLVYINNLDIADYSIAFFDADYALLNEICVKNETTGWKERVVDLSDSKYSIAEYLAVSCYDTKGTFTQFNAVLSNTSSFEHRLSLVESKTNYSIGDILEKQIPLIEFGYYDIVGNKVSTTNAMNTGLVSIDGYKRLECYTNLSSAGAIVSFYDKSKSYISALSIPGNGWEAKVLDLTEDKYATVGYIRISCYDSAGAFTKYRARLFNDNTLEYRISSLEGIKSIMPSKDRLLNILIFGDSITDSATFSVNDEQQTTSYKLLENGGYLTDESGATIRYSMWSYLITKYLSCFDVRNYAKSGASYREMSRGSGNERQNLSYQIQLALNDKSNPNGVFPTAGEYVPDIVIFALGTNDGTPTGSYDETMSKTIMSADGKSFDVDATLANLDITITCDAIRYAFLKIKQAFPQALYFCILPIQRASTEKPGINEVLEKMAKRYSIKVIDGYSDLGIVRDLEVLDGLGENLKDGLHPNDKGQKLFARMIVNAIKNNWVEVDL